MAAQENTQTQETLLLSTGVALMVMGAGLVLSNPGIRQFLMGQLAARMAAPEGSLQALSGVLPDLERYMKIRAM